MKGPNYKNRIEGLKDKIEREGLDSLLVTNENNVSYLSGFSGHDSILLLSRKKDFFITDSRYLEEAEVAVKGFDIRLVKGSTYTTIAGLARLNSLRRIGFESMDLPYGVAARLKEAIKKTAFVATIDMVETLRSIKDPVEIKLIRDSVRITKRVLGKAINYIKPGVSEKDLAKKIEVDFIREGAIAAFETIAASAANSSKPHAAPQDKRLMKNSFIMLDIGCRLNGYCSDLTRMIFLGKVKKKILEIYRIVKTAQEIAIAKIKPGVRICEIDMTARRYIQDRGFGGCFGHSLGHGLGLAVHEKPTISKSSEGPLRPGMVFTVEPAIYIPKVGGVRIEDVVFVTDSGCEVLTR